MMEIKQYNQWVCWRLVDRNGKKTKLPINPHTGAAASSTNPTDWASYDVAVKASQERGLNGVGFVLTKDDPFVCIDIDKDNDMATLKAMWDDYQTYIERSQSGIGYHIWGTTKHKQAGVRRGNVEVYSQERFIIWTGEAIRVGEFADITAQVDALVNSIKEARTHKSDVATVTTSSADGEGISKDELNRRILSSTVSDKFKKLFIGDWADDYPSQSEADLAFCSYLAFFGASDEQIIASWQKSKLWRDKSSRLDYQSSTLSQSRQSVSTTYDVDISAFLDMAEDADDEEAEKLIDIDEGILQDLWIKVSQDDGDEIPPCPIDGYNQIIDDLIKLMPRPIKAAPHLALISFIGGVGGNKYNVFGMGINTYNVLVANSGYGKEGITIMLSELERVGNELGYNNEWMGAGSIASQQAMIKMLSKNNCRLSVMSEFGVLLKRMLGRQASAAMAGVHESILQLYGKSGRRGVYQKYIAAGEDKATDDIQSPSLTIMAETTGSTLFKMVSHDEVLSGFVPRYFIWEASQKMEYINTNASSHKLSDHTIGFVGSVMSMAKSGDGNPMNINITDGARDLYNQMDKFIVDTVNKDNDQILSALFARMMQKSIKIAACAAVAGSPVMPLITQELLIWSTELVMREIYKMYTRICSGKIGANAGGSELTVIEQAVKTLFNKAVTNPNKSELDKRGIIRVSDIWRKVRKHEVWGNHNNQVLAFNAVVDGMCRAGYFNLLPEREGALLGVKAKCIYIPQDEWRRWVAKKDANHIEVLLDLKNA